MYSAYYKRLQDTTLAMLAELQTVNEHRERQ